MTDISIIVPIYNAENYLYQCLESLVDQHFKDIEIICVDDCSTDKSVEILERAAIRDSRIKIVNQDKNRGAEVARRRGLEVATGKYIMFCDTDDWYEPDMCQEMFNVMEFSGVDLAICKTNAFREDGENTVYNYNSYDFDVGGIEDINISLIEAINTVLWNKIFKREIIERNNITFPEFKDIRTGWGDFFVTEYMLFSKKIFFLDKVLHNYRIRKDSLTGELYDKVSDSKYDVWNNLEKFYEIINSKNLINEEVLKFFLAKYSNITKHYFDYLPTIEDRIQAMNYTREFLENIKDNRKVVASFQDKYLKSLFMMSHDFIINNNDDNDK